MHLLYQVERSFSRLTDSDPQAIERRASELDACYPWLRRFCMFYATHQIVEYRHQ